MHKILLCFVLLWLEYHGYISPFDSIIQIVAPFGIETSTEYQTASEVTLKNRDTNSGTKTTPK